MEDSENPEKSRKWSNRTSINRVGFNRYLLHNIMALNFNVVEAAQNANGVFEFCNFSQNGPCDMCWGDLSL